MPDTAYFDDLETRSADQRQAEQAALLRTRLASITYAPADWRAMAAEVRNPDDLVNLPVLRKSELSAWQKENPPFGGIAVSNLAHVFQSPGPIYEPGGIGHDWWRMGRFLHAAGIGKGDIVQNCFGGHDL